MCLTRAEYREGISSLDLLAMLLLKQLRRLLAAFVARTHCWLMFSLSTRTSISSSKQRNCFPTSAPNLYWGPAQGDGQNIQHLSSSSLKTKITITNLGL